MRWVLLISSILVCPNRGRVPEKESHAAGGAHLVRSRPGARHRC